MFAVLEFQARDLLTGVKELLNLIQTSDLSRERTNLSGNGEALTFIERFSSNHVPIC